MMATTTCPLLPDDDEATLAALLTIDDQNDVVLTITESEATEEPKSKEDTMSTDQFLQSDLEDLESITVIQLDYPSIRIVERLERFLLQRRKQGHRVRVITKQEIRDWGSPTAATTSSGNKMVYENDCRFQMRMQRYR
jgi:hypothetical protein